MEERGSQVKVGGGDGREDGDGAEVEEVEVEEDSIQDRTSSPECHLQNLCQQLSRFAL